MWLEASCEFTFEIPFPTPFVLMLRPRSGAQQWVAREEYRFVPHVSAAEFMDAYGNLCQRLVGPPGPFSIRTACEVKAADAMDIGPGQPFIEVQYLPDGVLGYLLPSRYCESERFTQMAMEITEGRQPGYDQVAAIVDWVRRNIRYLPGSNDNPISAVEVNTNGYGVCRDLAHIAIAMCRALAIPARMVVGYLDGLAPMDMHAWIEAYVGWRWYTFDPTQPELGGGYVSIGYGRDAADVAVYNQFGPPVYPLSQKVSVRRLEQR